MRQTRHSTARDLLALAKPHISTMSAISGAGGLVLAPSLPGWGTIIAFLAGTFLVVAAAGALNMVLEQDVDARMERTRDRPIAAGRLSPWLGTALGLTGAVLSVGILALGVNPLTATLGAVGLVVYVLVYTPLKRITPLALPVGAVAGAMPPLMGWAAATETLAMPGLVLFSVFFIWQVPHFLVISLFRRGEYARAGLRVASLNKTDRAVGWRVLLWTGLLLPVSLLLLLGERPVWLYGVTALALGLWLLRQAVRGLRAAAAQADPAPDTGGAWARRFFFSTLAYPPLITLSLMLEALVR